MVDDELNSCGGEQKSASREDKWTDEGRWLDGQRLNWGLWSTTMEIRLRAEDGRVHSRQLRTQSRLLRLARFMEGANLLTVAITERILAQRKLL
jgi:hypothetical protein